MGKNMAGLPEITFRGLDKGQKVRMRYAEVCYPDMKEYELNKGMVMMENIRAACAQDLYYAAGMEEETFATHFTLHDYRYVEITGIPEPLPVEDVKGRVLSSLKLGSAGITVAYEAWRQTGRTEILEEHYDAMARYLDFVANNYIEKETNLFFQSKGWGGLGDWLSLEYNRLDNSSLYECYYIFELNCMADVAYRLLQSTTYPSWLYPVTQGATTIWERLNSYNDFEGFGGNNSMNSFNHYSFGAVGQWMMSRILGIERDDHHAGFEHFVLRPMPDSTGQMTFARGWYDVPQGQIRAGWEQHEGGFLYRFTIPAGCSATLVLDGQEPQECSAGEHEVIL